MTWVYIIIGLVVVIGLVYWVKSKKKEGGADLSTPSIPPIPPETPPETPQPTETEETSSDEEKPM